MLTERAGTKCRDAWAKVGGKGEGVFLESTYGINREANYNQSGFSGALRVIISTTQLNFSFPLNYYDHMQLRARSNSQ